MLSAPARSATCLLAVSAASAALLSGCGLFDGSSHLDDAAEYLPAGTPTVEFLDRKAMTERLGLDDVDPRKVTEDDIADYLDATGSMPWGSDLAHYLRYAVDAPFHEFDVRWSAIALLAGEDGDAVGTPVHLYKVDDDLDLSDFTDLLTDSDFTVEEQRGLDVYTAAESSLDGSTGTLAGHYPMSFRAVLVVPDEHLVVTSGAPDADATDRALGEVAAAVTDDVDSLADDPGDLEPLLDDAGDAEYAHLFSGPLTCSLPEDGLPDAEADATTMYDGLGSPIARSVIVEAVGEDKDDLIGRTELLFGDDEAAESDLAAREALISEGADPQTGRPISDLGEFEVERDGATVTVTGDGTDDAFTLVRAAHGNGGPALCVRGA